MNIETAKEYLKTAHMNRKVANYLIQTIDELEEESCRTKTNNTLFNKKYNTGYNAAKAGIWSILHKER